MYFLCFYFVNYPILDVPFENLNFYDLEDNSHIRIEISDFDVFWETQEINKIKLRQKLKQMEEKLEEQKLKETETKFLNQ